MANKNNKFCFALVGNPFLKTLVKIPEKKMLIRFLRAVTEFWSSFVVVFEEFQNVLFVFRCFHIMHRLMVSMLNYFNGLVN